MGLVLDVFPFFFFDPRRFYRIFASDVGLETKNFLVDFFMSKSIKNTKIKLLIVNETNKKGIHTHTDTHINTLTQLSL